MKKFAKMSLVAAVAVAGLTSANAGSLEEAIKGVDVSGQFRYRLQESNTGETNTDVEVELTAKVPVNDMVTAVFKFDTTRNTNDGNTQGADFIDVEDYYFQYVNGPLTVLAGQQNIPGRLTDGLQGDGLVALYNTGAGFTIGGASFVHTNAAADTILNSIIAMGKVGPVSLHAQWADASDVVRTYNIKADADFGPAKVGVEYTDSEFDADPANADDKNTFKAYVAAKVGPVSGTLAYVKTGDNGSGSIDQDSDAASEFLLWQMGSGGAADLAAFAIDASYAVTDKISLRAAYADGEIGAGNTDITETLGQVSYKMSKNLNTYVRYSKYELGTAETDLGRVEVKYSF